MTHSGSLVRTHPSIDQRLCGQPVKLADGYAEVALVALDEMAADARGLVHGGFVFGLVDYAAMLAVNDPNVVLGAATCRFVAPVTVGERVLATATRTEQKGKKHVVEVEARVGERLVVEATLTTFVLEHHVLDVAAKP